MSVASHAPAFASAALIDPQALMTIRSLELRARAVVDGFWHGIHRSPYHGFSVEFTEYRQYTPGDDLRYLDWRVFGRSDRFFIKKYEDETNVRCHLLVDQSRSMDYGTRGYSKAHYAATLAATLACFLERQGDAVGLLTFDEKVRDYLPARHRHGHLRQMMLALERPGQGSATDLGAALERIIALIRKRGLVTLISDFLAPLDRLERQLSALAACGHEIYIFHVLDPVELNLGLAQPALIEDIESARAVYVDPSRTRDDYVAKLETHCKALRKTCAHLGIRYHLLSTGQPLELALFEFVRERAEHGRRSRGHRIIRSGASR
jgi:uncharacterized protein (DUF58 family)